MQHLEQLEFRETLSLENIETSENGESCIEMETEKSNSFNMREFSKSSKIDSKVDENVREEETRLLLEKSTSDSNPLTPYFIEWQSPIVEWLTPLREWQVPSQFFFYFPSQFNTLMEIEFSHLNV